MKVVRDILKVGDVWAVNLSALELHNAKAKRVADTGGSRRIVLRDEPGKTRAPRKKAADTTEGAAQERRVITTKAYSTTMALSTLNKLLAGSALRRGYGIGDLRVSGIDARRRERLFGEGPGRVKRLAAGVKLETLGDDYDPRKDTCVKAFVRMLAASAEAATAAGTGA